LTLLNLGCGGVETHAPEPWVNVDSWEGSRADVIADVLELPFDNGSAEAIYCGHILEHLDEDYEVPRLLREVRRVLGEFGQLCVVGPDYNRAITNPAWLDMIPQIMHGDHEHPGSEHRWLSSAWKNLLLVRSVFPAAREVDIRALSCFWPLVANVGWQFALLVEE
jgi:predicted SAM-dependent methyltransferase